MALILWEPIALTSGEQIWTMAQVPRLQHLTKLQGGMPIAGHEIGRAIHGNYQKRLKTCSRQHYGASGELQK